MNKLEANYMLKTKNDLFVIPSKKQTIMHLDMNSYFASCEQQANPSWRGKPVGVCSYLHPMGTIIAASIEAKALGISTGTKLWEAKLKEPKIILVRDEPTKYRVITERIRKIITDYTDQVENYSIDESFLCFHGTDLELVNEKKKIVKLALEIKQRIKKEVGDWLNCSVGIAKTRFLAKVASDYKKPDGLVIIDDKNIDSMLRNLSLTDLWGISRGLKGKLNSLGIFSPLDIKKSSPLFLMKKMGRGGYFLWSRLNALEVDSRLTRNKTNDKSLGHSYTLIEKTDEKKKLALLFLKLCEKIGRRLRKQNKVAKTCFIGWKYAYGGGFACQEKINKITDDSLVIFQIINKHLTRKILAGKIRKIFVNVSGLEEKKTQLNFFTDEIKNDRLWKSIDELNDRYGDFAVRRGIVNNLEGQIPDRIAFGH